MIKKGERVYIRKECQDAGDDKYIWIATDNEEKGRVTICPVDIELPVKPTYVVSVAWLEAAQ